MNEKIVPSLSDLDPSDFPQENSQTSHLDVDLGEIVIPIKSPDEQKKLQENSKAVRKFVEEHLRKIDASRTSVREANIDPEDKKKIQEGVQKIWKKITDLLNRSQVAAYRMAAWVGLLVHMFKSAKPKNQGETMDHLNWMVKNKYLIEVEDPKKDKASLCAWKRGFRVPEHACFGRPEFEEVNQELQALVQRVMTQTINRRDIRAKELQTEATLQPEDAFKKGLEKGTSFLYIPPQITFKEDKVRWYQGGYVLVDKDGDRIYPIEGIGSFEEDLREAYACEVFVKTYTLDWDFPPNKLKLEEAGLDQDQIKGFYLFWNLLKRAKDRLQKDNRHAEEKKAISRNAQISEESFFLERQDGTTLVDFEGVWENWITQDDGKKRKTETITDLFILVERRDGRINIVCCPEHLKTFFGNCMDSYREGEKFFGVPQPLQAILQVQYGACQTKSLIA